MINRTLSGMLAAPMLLLFTLAVSADTLDALQGAWTMDGTDCATTFKKVGNNVEFIDRTSSLTTGIIISGRKITGTNMSCTAERIRPVGDHFSALLNCADSITFNTSTFSFRIIDADHFERFEADFPDMSFSYERCKL
jgi:hypothetical protein